MKSLRFFLTPVLLLALITTSLYVGLARPGAAAAFATKVVSTPEGRADIATALVDQLVDSDDVLLKALLIGNREQAETAIAQSLSQEVEQQQIAQALEGVFAAMFTGQPVVRIDPQPIYRPIYQALDAIFPALKLTETNLDTLTPVVIGESSPLPDLRIVRTLLTASLALWPIWFLLVFLYIRHEKRKGWRTVGVQTLVIAAPSVLITLAAPLLLKGLVNDPFQKLLVGGAIGQLTFAALFIALALVIASTITLLLTRERVVSSQSAPESE